MSDLSQPAPLPKRSLRRPMVVGLLAAGILAVFVLFWFQPQKLLIDERVDEGVPEAAPGATSPSGTGAPETSGARATSTAPTELARGMFVSLDHATSGIVRVLQIGDNTRVVRLEGFETDNGPDLYLYMTTNRAGGNEGAFDDEFINLGRLKGNQGDQNYDLAADTDLARFQTVVIWCDRFNSAFGAADLSEV